ncbi:MAG: hypothetical protein JSS72_03270 [Armatimonadetes bacterium]|nr:hypothetical protein [Armatimonadota bacterium]
MDEIIEKLMDRAGISEEQAQQVMSVIQEHIHELPAMFGGDVLEKVKGAFGGLFSGTQSE